MFKKFVVKNQPASPSSKLGIRVLLIGIAMLTFSQCAGCKLGIKDAAMLTLRDTVWSKRAYNLRYGNCEREYSEHFQNGFCAGYTDTCNGGDGYVPALPPVSYRSPEYQSSDGAKCVNSWFEGFPAGVAAAKKDRAGTYHDVLISRMIDSAVSQSKTEPVLPGDVKVVATEQTDRGTNRNPTSTMGSRTDDRQTPLNSMPSILSPASFDAPPQAYAQPPEMPNFALPDVVRTDYAAESEMILDTTSIETVGSGVRVAERFDAVEILDPSQQLPAQRKPVNLDPAFR